MPAAGAAALRCAVGQCLNASCVLPLGSLSCGLLGVGLLASPPLWGRAGRSGRGRLWCTEGGREAAGRPPRSLLTSGPLLVWQPSGACSRRRAACRGGLCRGGPACARVGAGCLVARAPGVRRCLSWPVQLDMLPCGRAASGAGARRHCTWTFGAAGPGAAVLAAPDTCIGGVGDCTTRAEKGLVVCPWCAN